MHRPPGSFSPVVPASCPRPPDRKVLIGAPPPEETGRYHIFKDKSITPQHHPMALQLVPGLSQVRAKGLGPTFLRKWNASFFFFLKPSSAKNFEQGWLGRGEGDG